ncbi:MAG: FAD-dependent oxidoreductase [Lachnospiraceae bacterium]
MPILVKFCPDHGVQYPGFRQLPEGLELAKYLAENGVDALHVDAGCYEKWQLSMPAVFYQEAVMQLRSAKAVREAVSIPVLTHGRLSNYEKASAALRDGICDFAVIGRGLIADPDMPNKLAEGRPEDILPLHLLQRGPHWQRAQGRTPALRAEPLRRFREDERKAPAAETPKRVLVVGGGPGGCTAALLAKQAGHEVELWERSGTIGGKTLAASAPYMKADMLRPAELLQRPAHQGRGTCPLLQGGQPRDCGGVCARRAHLGRRRRRCAPEEHPRPRPQQRLLLRGGPA